MSKHKSVMSDQEWSDFSNGISDFMKEILDRTPEGKSLASDLGLYLSRAIGIVSYILVNEMENGGKVSDQKIDGFEHLVNMVTKHCFDCVRQEADKQKEVVDNVKSAAAAVDELLASIMGKKK